MEKVIRNGLVAVLYSPNHGAGWFSWHGIEQLLYDPSIVHWLENRHSDDFRDTLKSYLELKYPDAYFSGLDSGLGYFELAIKWIPIGEEFRIHEYDGAETVIPHSEEKWLTA